MQAHEEQELQAEGDLGALSSSDVEVVQLSSDTDVESVQQGTRMAGFREVNPDDIDQLINEAANAPLAPPAAASAVAPVVPLPPAKAGLPAKTMPYRLRTQGEQVFLAYSNSVARIDEEDRQYRSTVLYCVNDGSFYTALLRTQDNVHDDKLAATLVDICVRNMYMCSSLEVIEGTIDWIRLERRCVRMAHLLRETCDGLYFDYGPYSVEAKKIQLAQWDQATIHVSTDPLRRLLEDLRVSARLTDIVTVEVYNRPEAVPYACCCSACFGGEADDVG